MKMQVQATVIFEWEEDTDNWKENDNPPTTKEELLACVCEYASEDYAYILECKVADVKIEEAKTVKVTAPLVGMHFRPPAKAILGVLPNACPLLVVPEPDNAYDSNALQVFVASKDIPASQHEELASAAMFFGHSLEDILAQEQWHLGYIKATDALVLQPRVVAAIESRFYATSTHEVPEDENTFPGFLTFDSTGKPQVQMDLPD